MIYVEFKSVKQAKKYVPNATIAKQSFANSYMLGRVRIGRHEYITLYNKVSHSRTRIYVGDIANVRTQR